MGERLNTYLPRIAVLVLLALGATAGLTFAAGGTGTPSAATTASSTSVGSRHPFHVMPGLSVRTRMGDAPMWEKIARRIGSTA